MATMISRFLNLVWGSQSRAGSVTLFFLALFALTSLPQVSKTSVKHMDSHFTRAERECVNCLHAVRHIGMGGVGLKGRPLLNREPRERWSSPHHCPTEGYPGPSIAAEEDASLRVAL